MKIRLPPSGPEFRGANPGDIAQWTGNEWITVPTTAILPDGTVSGQLLVWSGAAWVPTTPTPGTTLVARQVLSFDDTVSVPSTFTLLPNMQWDDILTGYDVREGDVLTAYASTAVHCVAIGGIATITGQLRCQAYSPALPATPLDGSLYNMVAHAQLTAGGDYLAVNAGSHTFTAAEVAPGQKMLLRWVLISSDNTADLTVTARHMRYEIWR